MENIERVWKYFWGEIEKNYKSSDIYTTSFNDERKHLWRFQVEIEKIKERYKIDIFSTLDIRDISLREALYHVHHGHDFYTNRIIQDVDAMHIDHIIPSSRGGKDCIANYVPVINMTNRRKYDRYHRNISKRLIDSNILMYAEEVLGYYIIFKHGLDKNYTVEQLIELEVEIKEKTITGLLTREVKSTLDKKRQQLEKKREREQVEFMKKLKIEGRLLDQIELDDTDLVRNYIHEEDL